MSDILKPYYETEGPFGLPMRDKQAQALDALVKTLPAEEPFLPRQQLLDKGVSELLPGERADVSWISEESPDRQGEIVLAAGMDESHFRLNPLVTMQHAYHLPPVGRSLWRKRVRDGALIGIKAKTQYPARPANWPASSDWPPDVAFTLVQAGLLRGKSIGFLPLQARRPTDAEIEQQPALGQVRFIIEKWLLLEYACVFLPAQQNAVVEAVSKGLRVPEAFRAALGLGDWVVPFTPFGEYEKALERALLSFDAESWLKHLVEQSCAKLRGRV